MLLPISFTSRIVSGQAFPGSTVFFLQFSKWHYFRDVNFPSSAANWAIKACGRWNQLFAEANSRDITTVSDNLSKRSEPGWKSLMEVVRPVGMLPLSCSHPKQQYFSSSWSLSLQFPQFHVFHNSEFTVSVLWHFVRCRPQQRAR